MDNAFPAQLTEAIEQFNQGEFYACHDTLEALWIDAIEVDKRFYQGILQIAVGLYHHSNGNWRGAVILLGEGLSRLRSYLPDYADLDLESFSDAASGILETLQTLGPDRVTDLQIVSIEASLAQKPTPDGKIICRQPMILPSALTCNTVK